MGIRRAPQRVRGLHAAGLVLAAAMLLPLAWLLAGAWALRDAPTAVGAFWSEPTREALWLGLVLAVSTAAACTALSVPLAWFTHATDVPFRRALRLLLNLPLAVPSYVAAFVVVGTFAPGGWLAELLGSPPGEVYGFAGAFLALLFTYPLALIPMQAALSRTSPSQWNAARSLGATPVQAFRRVILPRMRTSIAGGALLVALYAISDFGAVSLLRYESLSYVIYVRYKSLFDKDEAIFLALLLGLVAVGFIGLYRLIRGSADLDSARSARAWPTIALGGWRWPAFLYCAAHVALGVVLPTVTVAVWLVRGASRGNTIGDPWGELGQSLFLGACAAIITVLLAIVPALLSRFGTSRAASLVHTASHIGYALPGIVVALSLVYFGVHWANPIYQTTALLLFAYVVRFLPLAVGVIDDALRSQSPRLFDAARVHGSTAPQAIRRVVLPGARPALAAAGLVVFIAVIKELPATLLLSPLDMTTLATRIWMLTEEAFFTAAAIPVLLMLVVAGVALWLRPDSALRDARRVE